MGGRTPAARAGIEAACALTVSDMVGDEVTSSEDYLPLDELDRAIDRMIDVALAAGTGSLAGIGAAVDSPA